jgi:hypothetical protein
MASVTQAKILNLAISRGDANEYASMLAVVNDECYYKLLRGYIVSTPATAQGCPGKLKRSKTLL